MRGKVLWNYSTSNASGQKNYDREESIYSHAYLLLSTKISEYFCCWDQSTGALRWLKHQVSSWLYHCIYLAAFIDQKPCPSVAKSCPTLCNPWTVAYQASLSFTVLQSLFKLMSMELVMPFNRIILYHPLLLLPSIFPSIRVFSSESAHRIRWAKYCSFSINPSNEYSGLISFQIDWFALLAVQGTVKTILHLHSSKASILQHSAFFMSNSHIHTWLLGKNHSFEYMDLCWQSDVSPFSYAV